ncbi:MAG: DUF2520 domain-containing protein [Lachnospiraceae bacterium]|nr:DUF2520 domain-containing protein [Lachnospiraceae bacterium]
MNIGFVGAGKVGCSLGKYFFDKGMSVTGYYSKTLHSAETAAEFVGTNYYESLETVVESSDCLFFTVTDSSIEEVWEKVKKTDISGKIICHCSGAKSASVFEGIDERGAYGFSLHPISPFSSRYESYKNVKDAYFTLEGNRKKMPEMETFLRTLGLHYTVISGEDKVRYHAACVFASNLMVGLVEDATELLVSSGFDRTDALKALAPLMRQNLEAIIEKGTSEALTGPMERADLATIKSHLETLDGNKREVYKALSRELLKIAKEKHKEKDYGNIERVLEQ